MQQFKGYERKEQAEWETLPKGAYIIKILNIKEEESSKGGSYLKIQFDIAEGEFKGFYKKSFENDSREDKKWSHDATIYITCPQDNSPQWLVDAFNKFMTAVEDSNKDYHWNWDEKTLKNKLVGAKFYNEQSEYNGKIYDHIKPKWYIAAQKIRDGKIGRLPEDKLVTSSQNNSQGETDFMNVPDNSEEEIPWD